MKGKVGFGSMRAGALRRASFNLWKEACIGIVGSRGSVNGPLEVWYKGELKWWS